MPLVAFSLYVPRPVRAALALVVLLALAGATYQGVTTSLERRRYPHPGRLDRRRRASAADPLHRRGTPDRGARSAGGGAVGELDARAGGARRRSRASAATTARGWAGASAAMGRSIRRACRWSCRRCSRARGEPAAVRDRRAPGWAPRSPRRSPCAFPDVTAAAWCCSTRPSADQRQPRPRQSRTDA